ncbi:MAG: protein of unknown function DUF1470 [uncultured Chloroflexia bacterium]|uniref:Zinc finger CGNR domain-containing protein n=1 Tax=uncultured Chloroflexia bacterium TaxID=1672391 RepID=A0A6J4H430_9CHLR|nr:MAG: protein of unknown function DUF1470 [uncultured Chloroflexia bacterium]
MAETHAGNLKLLGGRLCLDFVNTVDWHGSDHAVEFLHTYEDLLAWSRHLTIVTEDEVSNMLQCARRTPDQATHVLERAIALREALFRLFPVVAEGHAPPADDLAILNEALRRAPSRPQIAWSPPHFVWMYQGDDDALDRVLWPVAWSAADLLASAERERVKVCPGEDCGWLFLDASRNGTRRWCAMEGCGNRAKARRHYQRARKG